MMRRCPDCEQEKDESEFYTIAGGKLYSYCKPCTRKRALATRAKRIDAAREYNRQWRLANRDKALAAAQRWRDENRDWVRESNRIRAKKYAQDPNWNRKKNLHRNYKITLEQYEIMLNKQDRLCAVCRISCSTGKSLGVDHDHKTGTIRGLLCRNCNQGIGMFQDSIGLLEAAKLYLKKYME